MEEANQQLSPSQSTQGAVATDFVYECVFQAPEDAHEAHDSPGREAPPKLNNDGGGTRQRRAGRGRPGSQTSRMAGRALASWRLEYLKSGIDN